MKKAVLTLGACLFFLATAATAVVKTTPTPTPKKKSLKAKTARDSSPQTVGASTCMACHSEHADLYKDSIHNRKAAAKKGLDFEKSCETCHGPGSLHAAAGGDRSDPGFASIRKLANLKGEAANAPCLSCHANGMQFHWKGSSHEMQGVACVSCHSIHQSEKSARKGLLKDDESRLCFTCHVEKKAQMKRQAHMPVEGGVMQCSSCHNVHGTEMARNLKGDSVTDACYKCHAEKRGPFLWDHPPVRENCLTCHDPHGSHHDKMLTDKQPFLCQRCHVGTSHPVTDYNRTNLTNRDQRMLAHGCTNCHSSIHGSNHPSGNRFTR